MSKATTPDSKPTIHIRPRPGQTELNWREWLILFGVIIVSLFICVNGSRSLMSSFRAAIPTVTPTPTLVKPTVTLLPTSTPAPTPSPAPDAPTAIDKGVWVAVIQGVNFRQDASTGAKIIRTLGEGEVLQVTDGPVSANDFIWWKLKDPNGTEGWAAQDYLQPTAPPQ